jgi:ribosomal protein L11 methylase PrmA
MSRRALLHLIGNLTGMMAGLSWKAAETEWANYAQDNTYTQAATQSNRAGVVSYLKTCHARTVWDLGANTGEYSRAARALAPLIVSFDMDAAAVERNYRRVRAENETGILPLLLDLRNPSPAQGWGERQRLSLAERGPADVVLALALIHHLAIGQNLPLEMIAAYLKQLCRKLIIEFVPKDDAQVKRLLLSRPDIFPDYTKEGFEQAFSHHFEIEASRGIEDSDRLLYHMSALD